MKAVFSLQTYPKRNLKLWAVASIAAAALAGYNWFDGTSCFAEARFLSDVGSNAEKKGQYKEARADFDLAIMRARASRNKDLLAEALINASRVYSYFEEDQRALSLAAEARGIYKQMYGDDDPRTAAAMVALADALTDSESALKIYKQALTVFKTEGKDKFKKEIAHILRELSYCYSNINCKEESISACKAALSMFASTISTEPAEYAESLFQYATIMDLEDSHRERILKTALSILERSLGNSHPELNATLLQLAALEKTPARKMQLLKRALSIDETTYGDKSLQTTRDLLAIRSAANEKSDKKVASEIDTDTTEEDVDSESDPEYCWRPRQIPIAHVENFQSKEFDHIQVIAEGGTLELIAYKEGEEAWRSSLGIRCFSNMVNVSCKKDILEVRVQEGDGPKWRHDIIRVQGRAIVLENSFEEDAYCQMLAAQLDEVLSGKVEADPSGAIHEVPTQYINANFLQNALKSGEAKALEFYGNGDSFQAARTLRSVFDFTLFAINTQREELSANLTEPEVWLDAWKSKNLSKAQYVNSLNDYGFYLLKSGDLKNSTEILIAVTRLAPERAVAFLNLGDALWANGDSEAANKAYQRFLTLNTGHCEKIPERVKLRMASKNVINFKQS